MDKMDYVIEGTIKITPLHLGQQQILVAELTPDELFQSVKETCRINNIDIDMYMCRVHLSMQKAWRMVLTEYIPNDIEGELAISDIQKKLRDNIQLAINTVTRHGYRLNGTNRYVPVVAYL